MMLAKSPNVSTENLSTFLASSTLRELVEGATDPGDVIAARLRFDSLPFEWGIAGGSEGGKGFAPPVDSAGRVEEGPAESSPIGVEVPFPDFGLEGLKMFRIRVPTDAGLLLPGGDLVDMAGCRPQGAEHRLAADVGVVSGDDGRVGEPCRS